MLLQKLKFLLVWRIEVEPQIRTALPQKTGCDISANFFTRPSAFERRMISIVRRDRLLWSGRHFVDVLL